MSIEKELTDFLVYQTNGSETANRDIEVVMHHYGFRDKFLPTYEETAHFAGLETKQRAEQIVSKYFKSIVEASDLPSLKRFRNILIREPYWQISELYKRCSRYKLIDGASGVQTILDLALKVGLNHNYEIYTNNFKKAAKTKPHLDSYFVVDRTSIPKIRPLIRNAKNLPGQNGIANLRHLRQGSQIFREFEPLIRDFLSNMDHAWTKDEGDDFWYIIEGFGRNPLQRYGRRVFSMIESADLDKLAESYRKALHEHTGKPKGKRKYRHPPFRVIRDYLKASESYEVRNGLISYSGATEAPLDSEITVVGYLRSNPDATSSEIRGYLNKEGHKYAKNLKRVFNSPFVQESGTRKNYVYNLVGELKHDAIEIIDEIGSHDRYLHFKNRLDELEDTDELDEHNRRKDQPILRSWLFENREFESCGICGCDYSINALVAAHKKKREECRDDERRDPHIVMPMCVFGCDFLYERGHIIITDGAVDAGLPVEHDGPEKEFVAKVINRRVDERWLQGPEGYFKK